MPILVLWGLDTKKAVALALFDSVFIALPSVIGYWVLSDINNNYEILIVTLIAHGIGVVIGTNTSKKVNQFLIKVCVGIFSVIVALWKLIPIFI